MPESLQKIIDDCKVSRDYHRCRPASERIIMMLNEIINRLEALQKQPVAWMTDTPEDATCAIPNRTKRDVPNGTREYTIPLIRGD